MPQHFRARGSVASATVSQSGVAYAVMTGGSCGHVISLAECHKAFATAISSARRVGSRPTFSRHSGWDRVQAASVMLWRSTILRLLAELVFGDALDRTALCMEAGVRVARTDTSDEVTFGGGTKAEGAMSNRILAAAPPAHASRP